MEPVSGAQGTYNLGDQSYKSGGSNPVSHDQAKFSNYTNSPAFRSNAGADIARTVVLGIELIHEYWTEYEATDEYKKIDSARESHDPNSTSAGGTPNHGPAHGTAGGGR